MTAIESMLISWKQNTHGRYITLKLPDDDALEPFKSMKTGSANGQRLGIAFAIIADDESEHELMADASTGDDEGFNEAKDLASALPNTSAAKPKREITLAERIGIICSDENFRKFLQLEKTVIWNNVLKYPRQAKTREWIVAEVVRVICGVNSRSEITYDSEPSTKWKQLYTEYEDCLEKNNE